MGKKTLKPFNEAVEYLIRKTGAQPEAGIVLGSGLGSFISEVDIEKEIPYEDIPHFPVSTVEGHKGKLIFGRLSGKQVMVMAGRFHFYEGYNADDLVFPVRIMKLLGVKTLLLSNAAGSVNPRYKVGDMMVINDHISFFTPNPLVGKNIAEFGPRFPDMNETYDRGLIEKARAIGITHGFDLHEGVYVAVTGPTFETRAEYRFIHILGGDVVGMSTVPEAIVARHMDMKVFAVSVVTDLGMQDQPISHEEVLEAAKNAEPKMATLFRELVAVL
jgi:purine-nucleoside phosphorylase